MLYRIRSLLIRCLSSVWGVTIAANVILLGSVVAGILSWSVNQSIGYLILNAFIGWPSVIYYAGYYASKFVGV